MEDKRRGLPARPIDLSTLLTVALSLRKIGIYGGTFDPVHHGHLILAREAVEVLRLEKVIFVPAAVSPHKQAGTAASGAVRVEMVQTAIAGEAVFAMDDWELHRASPSYTFDTVEHLRATNPDAEFYLIIGEDHLPQLSTWHRFEELRTLVSLVVLERSGAGTEHAFRFIRRQINISSTDIRNRVASGQSIRYLVPQAVEEIIQREQLYQEPKTSPQKS